MATSLGQSVSLHHTPSSAPSVRRDSIERARAIRGSVQDPSRRRPEEEDCRYTLTELTRQLNELSVLRAVSDYPGHLFGADSSCLGYLGFDIDKNGSVTVLPWSVKMSAVHTDLHSTRCRFGALYLNLSNTHRQEQHSNLVLVDTQESTVERFEPHGSNVAHALQDPSGFRAFYDAASVNRAMVSWLQNTSYEYCAPLSEFPVLCQSLSTSGSSWNSVASVASRFKPSGSDTSGDSFCSGWTTYYMMLRIRNPSRSPAYIYAYLARDYLAEVRADAPANYIHTPGRHSADMIAGFIQYAHSISSEILSDPAIVLAIRRLHAEEQKQSS